MSMYQQAESVDVAGRRTTVAAERRHFSPGQVIGGLAGLILVIFGVIAVTRTGVDSSLNQPTTEIMGLTHSALVGLIEIGVGLLIVVSAASYEFRGFMGTMGVLAFLGGVVVAAAGAGLMQDIGAEKATGWFVLILGAITVLASLLPTIFRSRRVVEGTYGTGVADSTTTA